ncbi:MAG: glutathione transferase GstA [Bdellovibrionales bacterium]|nr:glutathione transferase GstA [Bdellovibrionales bacterium]
MKLYYAPGTCSLAPHISLIEAGKSFHIEKVDIKTKKFSDGGDYLQVNPKGSVPALVMENGEVLTEGVAILQYIADLAPEKHLAPPAGTLERYRLQEWLNFITTEIHKNFSVLFNADRYVAQPEGNEQLKNAIKQNLKARFALVARHMKEPFLMGDHFTVADAYLFTVLRWTKPFTLDLNEWPALAAHFARVRDRASVKAALQAESPRP